MRGSWLSGVMLMVLPTAQADARNAHTLLITAIESQLASHIANTTWYSQMVVANVMAIPYELQL